MTITFYKFGSQWGIADPSPFCIKLENFFRWAKIDYQTPEFKVSFFKTAPKGKFPFIQKEDGQIIGDSNLVIDHLVKNGAPDPDASLSTEEKATSLAFRRMLDENLYWVLLYSRWKDEPGWSIVGDMFFGDVPALMRGYVKSKQQKIVWGKARGHGMGRHSHEEIYAIGRKDIQALSDYLGSKKYFLGKEGLTLIDLCLHAFIINIVEPPIDNDLKECVLEKQNLVNHARHIQELLYVEESASMKEAA